MPLVDKIPDMHFGPSWMGLPSVEQLRNERFAKCTDPLYLSLVNQLGPGNSQDAWHIRTAEANDMFCFLTMDFKLLKTLNARSGSTTIQSLRTRILTPEDLGKHLRLAPVSPTLLSYRDANSPIRPDLHWPDSSRQKPRRQGTGKNGLP